MATERKKTGKHPGGRPPLFEDVNVLQAAVDEYFVYCDENKKPYTMSGLANHLGMCRKTLLNYSKSGKFLHTLKKAREKVHQYAEEYLYSGKNVTGAIFNLKNNFGWKDQTDHKHDISDPLQSLLEKISAQGPPKPSSDDNTD